jgi:hypothetical protein
MTLCADRPLCAAMRAMRAFSFSGSLSVVVAP